MNGVLSGVLTGLGSMLGFGLSDFFAAKSTKKESSLSTVFNAWLIEFLILVPFVLWQFSFSLNWLILFKILLYSFMLALAYVLFYRGLEIGPVSIVIPLTATYPLFAVVLAVLGFGEVLVFHQYLAIALILVGIFLTSLKLEKSSGRAISKSGILYALAAALLFGGVVPLLDQSVAEIGWLMTVFYQFLFGLVWLYLIFGLRRGFRSLTGKGFNRVVLGLAVFHLLGVSFFSFGLDKSLASIVTPVSAAYPLITVALALVFLKERVAKYQLLGAVLIIAGIVILSIS